MAMNQFNRELWAVAVFALGGAFLTYAVYSILDTVGDSFVDQRLFLWFFVVPFSFMAFALIGYGLLLIIKSQKERIKA